MKWLQLFVILISISFSTFASAPKWVDGQLVSKAGIFIITKNSANEDVILVGNNRLSSHPFLCIPSGSTDAADSDAFAASYRESWEETGGRYSPLRSPELAGIFNGANLQRLPYIVNNGYLLNFIYIENLPLEPFDQAVRRAYGTRNLPHGHPDRLPYSQTEVDSMHFIKVDDFINLISRADDRNLRIERHPHTGRYKLWSTNTNTGLDARTHSGHYKINAQASNGIIQRQPYSAWYLYALRGQISNFRDKITQAKVQSYDYNIVMNPPIGSTSVPVTSSPSVPVTSSPSVPTIVGPTVPAVGPVISAPVVQSKKTNKTKKTKKSKKQQMKRKKRIVKKHRAKKSKKQQMKRKKRIRKKRKVKINKKQQKRKQRKTTINKD